MSQQGCDPLYIKQMRIEKTARAGGRVQVRRVLWRQDRIVVYQDMAGRYLWADLDAKKQRAALIAGGPDAA